jgi:hypothetical protein
MPSRFDQQNSIFPRWGPPAQPDSLFELGCGKVSRLPSLSSAHWPLPIHPCQSYARCDCGSDPKNWPPPSRGTAPFLALRKRSYRAAAPWEATSQTRTGSVSSRPALIKGAGNVTESRPAPHCPRLPDSRIRYCVPGIPPASRESPGESLMENPYRSPTHLGTRTARGPLPAQARIAILLAMWLGCPFVSVLSFYLHTGSVPVGTNEWIWYPLITSPITLPGSAGLVVYNLLEWLPGDLAMLPASLAAIAFWPLYVTVVVLVLQRGTLRYLVLLAVLNLLASVYWHFISLALVHV